MSSKIINFTLNGRPIEAMVKPLTTLQALLREQLGLTATKAGCKQGACGSCTVLVNGDPMMSCILPAEDIQDQEIITLEGLSTPTEIHPLQESFYNNFAIQCGYCSPGMLMVSKALIDQNPHPSREEIIAALTGNYCRCTGYEPIIQAIGEAARRMNGESE
jgi:aerobic carbon-monoxide dehydrogenase small subunit